ncbi:DNA (cytosine-5-)-methyltransferase [Endozoicomonas gorgoniicola]|uniref:Cytosine-specific methyltransferase n=1 Tax=Endozoicomonas gorgoniicola TaxID=1234144 RepID=A0ABT3N3N4_9GAMM|nr:DNA (cytosine-5-)-methyltransferase [Endozoicomonas gorgoniicola]MCW7556224.1 DNA (cytosine-5-)-methyltransferase [Endozoicomonas gorgoniicola]
MTPNYYSIAQVADILGVSKETLRRWDNNGTLVPEKRGEDNNYRQYHRSQLDRFEQAQLLFNSNWDEEKNITPKRDYGLVELFAGAGGLAIGLDKAGFKSIVHNEIDKHACNTLRKNRPDWKVVEGDITNVDFTPYHGQVDIVSGGFPCQAFSYAGKKLGFEDTRGTMFFEFARAVKETNPKIFIAENVRGLLNHESGQTLEAIKNVIDELGYELVEPRVLKAIFYQVPQKRERLILVGIRKDLADYVEFKWPSPYKRIMTMRDALKKGDLYPEDVPESAGQNYPARKAEILANVPEGGYWRDLPDDLQREYMKKSYFLGGGKTGMARRLAWDEPSLTLTCAPAQKQTERCHPEETRPLTVREYARIQTFPDSWEFTGPLTAQYKQIGNAVPVNLAHAIGRSLIRLLNDIEAINEQSTVIDTLISEPPKPVETEQLAMAL